MFRSRVRTSVVVAALASLVGVLLTVGAALPTEAAPAKGVAYGTVKFPQKDSPKVKVLWFTRDWAYLGTANAQGDSYSLNLAPGTYHLQFVDQRDSYVTSKYAPTDIQVTVHSGQGTRKNVTMTKGAFITGTVKAHGKVAKKAEVKAANQSEQSFTTTANKKGQFAIGGLPAGKYSLFSYDHKHAWVDKSTYAGKLEPGKSANLAINLRKKAGSLRVYLFTSANGQKKQVTGNPTVTAVSKKTGQFWSKKVKGGNAVFEGLYPGKYKLVANGYGIWFGKTASVEGATVKSGKTDFGTFTYTKRGGWITGKVVDGNDSSFPMKAAAVGLYDSSGNQLTSTVTDQSGAFKLSGQFATMSGLTVTVDPDPNGGGWMQAAAPGNYCMFTHGEQTPVSITIGQQTDVGSVPLPHAPYDGSTGQPERCQPS
ncbi:carboxypeptidase-like regulatory domain-containing protein [Nocardioides sp. CN2-186]|uniref:carboxypeptidase-like regulatory domain-containing protein n=1 Tax=Nocardioides tweenelious TaxID=3156607 RepID=UPI0032B4D898